MKIKDRVLRFTRNQLCVFHRVIFIYKVLNLQDYYILYIYIYIYITKVIVRNTLLRPLFLKMILKKPAQIKFDKLTNWQI